MIIIVTVIIMIKNVTTILIFKYSVKFNENEN